MTTRVEGIIAVVEPAAMGMSAADTLSSSIEHNEDRYLLVNSVGQVLASVISAIPILRPVTLQFNTFAGTTTFLKVIMDVRDGKQINTGDVLSLIGNFAGLVGTVAFLAGAAPAIPLIASAISISAAAAAVINGSNFAAVSNWSRQMFDTYWPTLPIAPTSDLWMTSNGDFARYDDIINNPNLQFGAMRIDSNASWGQYTIVETAPPANDTDPGSGSDGDGG